MRLTFALLLLALAVTLGSAPRAQEQPRFSIGTNAVVIDVVVRDGQGRPITGLQRGDFTLLEDGVRQDIADVTPVARQIESTGAASTSDGGKLPADASGPGAPGLSFMALVFDRLSPEARSAAAAAARAAATSVGTSDFVGVFVNDQSLRTVQTFTNDQARLAAAISAAATTATAVVDRASERLSSPARGDSSPAVPFTASAEEAGRSLVQSRPTDDRSTDASVQAQTRMDAMTARMDLTYQQLSRDHQGFATTDGLLALIAALAPLPGRKSIVFFAEALAVPIAVQSRFDAVIDNANRANVAIYAVDAAGLRVHSNQSQTGRELDCLSGAAAGCEAIWASLGMGYDLADLRVDLLRKDPAAALGTLSRATGGFLINNTNDLVRGFRHIDADRRFYYLLTYTPKNQVLNGEWRKVTVAVNRRAVVRSRSGYLAVRSMGFAPVLTHEARALAALERAPRPRDIPVKAAVFQFPEGGRTRLAVLVSTPAAALAFPLDDAAATYRTDFTVLARVRSPHGEIVRKASQPYRLSGPASKRAEALAGEVLFFRQPTIEPGQYVLEAVVQDALASKAGVAEYSIDVPAAGKLAASSLIVVSHAERVTPTIDAEPNPLRVGDYIIYPNLGVPVDRAVGAVTLFMTVEASDGRKPSATLSVTRDDTVAFRQQLEFDALTRGRVQQIWRMPLDGLAAGRYRLQVSLADGERTIARDALLDLVDTK